MSSLQMKYCFWAIVLNSVNFPAASMSCNDSNTFTYMQLLGVTKLGGGGGPWGKKPEPAPAPPVVDRAPSPVVISTPVVSPTPVQVPVQATVHHNEPTGAILSTFILKYEMLF